MAKRKKTSSVKSNGRTGRIALAVGLLAIAAILLVWQGGGGLPPATQEVIGRHLGLRIAVLAGEMSKGQPVSVITFGSQTEILDSLKAAADSAGFTIANVTPYQLDGDEMSMSKEDLSQARLAALKEGAQKENVILLGGCPSELAQLPGKKAICFGRRLSPEIAPLVKNGQLALLVMQPGVIRQSDLDDPEAFLTSRLVIITAKNVDSISRQ